MKNGSISHISFDQHMFVSSTPSVLVSMIAFLVRSEISHSMTSESVLLPGSAYFLSSTSARTSIFDFH